MFFREIIYVGSEKNDKYIVGNKLGVILGVKCAVYIANALIEVKESFEQQDVKLWLWFSRLRVVFSDGFL